MHRPLLIGLTACLLAACQQQPEGEPVARAEIGPNATQTEDESRPDESLSQNGASQVESVCRSVIFENTSLTHCLALPSRHTIATRLAGSEGEKFASLSVLAQTVDQEGVAFAINAGEFGEGGEPVGYFVEDSERLHPLETEAGEGDFYLAPNGVFFGSGDNWEIRTTDNFLENVTDRPEWGTQSGPMLVIAGKLHPKIKHDGSTRMVRNAVGLDERGRAHFVISNAPISLGKLARFYRDELSAQNALMLDADASVLWNPATGRMDSGEGLGPFLLVTKKDTVEE